MWLTKRQYWVVTAAGARERRQQAWYTIEYRDAAGKTKRVKGYRDKGATKQLAAKLESQLARGEQGLVDPYRTSKATPLIEHVRHYIENLRTEGRSEGYIYIVERRLAVLLAGTKWTALGDIQADAFCRWRSQHKKNPRPSTRKDLREKGVAAETLNQYLETARAFLNWCVDTDRIASNVLARVEKVEGEKRRKRRALSDEQVATLLRATAADRRLVYRVGLAVGLRRSELEALKWGDLGLNAISPYVQLRAEATKARRGDRIYLPASLAADLRGQRPDDASDDDRVFRRVPAIDKWRDDLAAAGIPYFDAMGRQADFHAGTRKTLCTRMNRSGKSLVFAMKVMRHTDSKLTMVDYNDDEQSGLTDVLPEVAIAPPASDQASGTASA